MNCAFEVAAGLSSSSVEITAAPARFWYLLLFGNEGACDEHLAVVLFAAEAVDALPLPARHEPTKLA